MWFTYLKEKEKEKEIINILFHNELSTGTVEFDNYLFFNKNSISIRFISNKIPKHIPEQWKLENFNALRINFTLTGVTNFTTHGNKVGFKCTPLIEKIDNRFKFTIIREEYFYFSCYADKISVDKIEPYSDVRW